MLDYPRASNLAVIGGTTIYIAGLILLMAFVSPYWLSSYDETFSNFKNMGLWQYCFENFRYPYYQVDKLFNGCHSILSNEYDFIREWLLPGWMLLVQILSTLAFFFSYLAQGILVMILLRYPLVFVLENEWILTAVVSICSSITALFLFLAVIIFGSQCRKRDWLQYPNFNHLSWSYWFALISVFVHAIGAFYLYMDAKIHYARRRESRNLVLQMQPNSQTHHGLQRTNYI